MLDQARLAAAQELLLSVEGMKRGVNALAELANLQDLITDAKQALTEVNVERGKAMTERDQILAYVDDQKAIGQSVQSEISRLIAQREALQAKAAELEERVDHLRTELELTKAELAKDKIGRT